MKKIMLVILDGFGEAPEGRGNAVKNANMPYLNSLKEKYPFTFLKTEGNASGLPEGQTGASEPGHITIGAGRRVNQPLEEINQAFKTDDILQNFHFKEFLEASKGKRVHLLGMLSDGGVHSHIDHLNKLLEIFNEHEVFVHAIGDGRDVREQSIARYVSEVRGGKMASLVGRYYAMDRDQNWDRVKVAYDLYTKGEGERISGITDEIYRDVETDYYLPAFVFDDFEPISDEDFVLFYNFRSDRAQELTEAFTGPDFAHFERDVFFKKNFLAFGPYTLNNAPNAFPPRSVKNNLGFCWQKNGLKQLRIAETEKFAHVTFFFNSQIKEPFADEDRVLISSLKCASYAEKPKMSAGEVTERLVYELGRDFYDVVVLNYANADLVGHSGVYEKAKEACEYLDQCLARLIPVAQEKGFDIMITADHGNSDEMIYPDGSPNPSHSLNPVICLLVTDREVVFHEHAELSDIAPTLLDMQGLGIPDDMTGKSFIK